MTITFKGWIRTSLIDYPDHIATVLFTGGCNFRCPPCHNAGLVLRPEELPDVSEEEVGAFLSRRAGLIDGVVLTGGEPTLEPDLIPFLRRLRKQELDIKLDTNGYFPAVLQELLTEALVDYVAMDVKAPPEKYPLLTGRPDLDIERIEQSIVLLRESGIDHEFRTTIVPGLLDQADVEAIARWLADAWDRSGRGLNGTTAGPVYYVLQQFRPLNTLDPALERVSPYPVERLQAMAERAKRWVRRVDVRGE